MPAAARDTRSAILDVALDLFAAQGYDGVALSEIADRMGFTKAALYYHFKAKEELAAALLEPLFADIDRVLDEHSDRVGTAAGRRGLLTAYAEVTLNHRGLVRFAYADLSMLRRAGLGGRAQEQGTRLAALLTPDGAGLAGSVRAAVAIGGLQIAVAALADQNRDVVRDAAVAAAEGALRSRGGRTR